MSGETLYLIDGYAAIFRAFYAIRRPLYSPVTGEPTQAVLVFAQMLLKLFTQFQPDYVAVALDAPGRTFRDELYTQYPTAAPLPPPGEPPAEPVPTEPAPAGSAPAGPPGEPPFARYKGGRRATPDPLHQQVPRILHLLDLFGIPVISKPGLEADDVIATLTERVLEDPAHPDLRVRIVSRDKDLEQLLSPRVTLFDIHTEAELDVESLRAKRGVSPEQVADLLALTGDVVDNIPGVDGIGPRTAAKLVRQFGSLEGVLENLDQIKGWWRENLRQAGPHLPLSRRLITLERDPDIPFSLEAARVRPLPAEDLIRVFDELGFHRLKEPLLRLVEGAIPHRREQTPMTNPSTAAPGADLTVAYPWTPDQGDGTFRNPILCADYSDPDVIRHGDDFYLIASSFNCTPGLPILHSRDLVNWTIINHAVENLPDPRFAEVQHGQGVWAPAIRHHDGRFWIFFPMPDEGIYVTTAPDPAGQWSEPHQLVAGKGLIDPCPLWDDDGQAYLVYAYAGSRAGIKNRLRVSPMAPDGSRLLGEGEIVFHEPERHPTLEGPKFHKRDGWYYILAPAGGVATGWQLALRSRSVYGPYEEKIVLEQGGTPINGPHQGALVDLGGDRLPPRQNGEWWFVHFQELQPYGRIVHLQPVEWRDGWPLMGIDQDGNGVGEPVLRHPKPAVGGEYSIAIPQTSDEFEGETLGLQWQWHANHRDDWHSLSARRGWLRLFSQPVPGADFARAPNLLLQKLPARDFVVETALELAPQAVGEQAGVIVMGLHHAALSLQRTEGGSRLVYQVNSGEAWAEDVDLDAVRLRVTVRDGGECTFAYAGEDGGDFVTVGEPFPATEGKWIGAKVGIFSLTPGEEGPVEAGRQPFPAGHADFGYFRFSGPDGG